MKYMVGSDWINLFDIVIVNARKPKFFHPGSRQVSPSHELLIATQLGPFYVQMPSLDIVARSSSFCCLQLFFATGSYFCCFVTGSNFHL